MLKLKQVLLIVSISTGILALDNGLGLTPQMGWNSWNKFGCDINEDLIKETADALVKTGLSDLGYNYVNIDDCWQLSRDENGKIVEDKERFPSGMKALGEYIHKLGLNYGLYSSAGTKTCQGRPGSLGYEEIDAQTYAEWGVDYLKYDNCYNEGISGHIRYPKMRDALLKTGRPIFYSLCQWGEDDIATWAGEVGNSWRTTGDIEDNWDSFLKILDQQVGLEKYAKHGAWNDPDMLEVGNGGMTDNEYEAHFAFWALLKSPLIIGCDVRNLSEKTLTLLSNIELIEVNQDSLGIQGKRISRVEKPTGALEIWAGEQSTGHVMILFNRSTQKESITVQFKDIGYPGVGGNLANLITHENFGYVRDNYTTDVEPHSVVVLKLHQYCNEFMKCGEIN